MREIKYTLNVLLLNKLINSLIEIGLSIDITSVIVMVYHESLAKVIHHKSRTEHVDICRSRLYDDVHCTGDCGWPNPLGINAKPC